MSYFNSHIETFSCKMEECKARFTTKQCLQFHYRKSHNLTDESMPSIEREIPYTLSAYSGGFAVEDLKNNKRQLSSNECIGSDTHPSHANGAIPNNDLDESKDVYDFKESDDDRMEKKNNTATYDLSDIRNDGGNDNDENKSSSDANADDSKMMRDEDGNMNSSSVDADDESDDKMPDCPRIYKQTSSKARYSSRSNSEIADSGNIEKSLPTTVSDLNRSVSKAKRNVEQQKKTTAKHISTVSRTRPSTRSSKAASLLDHSSQPMIESSSGKESFPLSSSKIVSIDTSKPSVSACSLVLAALGAAEQDLGTNTEVSDRVCYSEKETQNSEAVERTTSNEIPSENDSAVTLSAYCETQRSRDDEEPNNIEASRIEPDKRTELGLESNSSVTITPHRSEKDSHEMLVNRNSAKVNTECLDNRVTLDHRVSNLYNAQENAHNIPEESSLHNSQHLNSVEITPVPNTSDISSPNGISTFDNYSKKDTYNSHYTKSDVRSISSFPDSQVKSSLSPRHPTPSASLTESHHSQHTSNANRSPSSLPPAPSAPHFPANSYPPHFPSTDLAAQFSNQLYHSGLDTLARSCYPQFRPHTNNTTPTDYSTFPRSSGHPVDFMSHPIPASTHEGSYGGAINGLNNFSAVNGISSSGISSSPTSSSLDLSQTSSAAAIAAAAVADILPQPGNPRSPFGNNSSPSHLSPFYPTHSNMINEHLLNVGSTPKDLTSPRLPPSNMQNAESSLRQPSNPYMHQNYSLYESSRFPASAPSPGYPSPPAPPNNHHRIPHISPSASPYHHYGYFQ